MYQPRITEQCEIIRVQPSQWQYQYQRAIAELVVPLLG